MSLIEFMTGEGLFKVSDGRIKERSDQSSIAGDKKNNVLSFCDANAVSQFSDRVSNGRQNNHFVPEC